MAPYSTRRSFLRNSLLVSAASAIGCGQEPQVVSQPELEVDSPQRGIQLSLSVRVAESFHNKKESSMTIEELIDLALKYDFRAMCMRASTAGIHTESEIIKVMADKILNSGLRVGMVTGDFSVPRNDKHGPDGLRNIKPYLDLAETFGADLIRVCMKKEEDIEWASRASDEAKERGIRLAHQSHNSSLFETVEGSLDVIKKVDRSNFGIIYEPANWMIAGEDYGPETIKRLGQSIFNVYVQNHRLNPEGEAQVGTWSHGPRRVDHIGLWEEGGVDFSAVFEGLHAVEYSGYLTIHQSFQGVMPVSEAVSRSSKFLASMTNLV